MGEMDFEKSTQAKYWMFDEASLLECREKACRSQDGKRNLKARKFACGYASKSDSANNVVHSMHTGFNMSANDQDILVHFHAHQIQRLIGPNAIFPQLRRGASVLSTAIMLFRRFYLSNSAVDFHPRNIAAASALLSVKADCEERIPIDVLSHATWVVQIRAQNAPLCRDELRAVTIQEIEEAERSLLEGCVYHLRCHHPYGAIKVLSADVTTHSLSTPKETSTLDCSTSVGATKSYGHGGSPRSVYGYQAHQDPPVDESLNTICERALSIAQSALVYSDVNFLFPPGQIAFAAVTLALDGHRTGGTVGPRMSEYLSIRFRNKSAEELSQFKGEVRKIIRHLDNCPAIDLDRFSPSWQYRDGRAAEMQAAEIRRVFHVAARCRVMKGATFQVIGHPRSLPPPPSSVISPVEGYYHQNHHHYNSHHHLYFEGGGRKRDREECDQWTPYHHAQYYKVARITPITTPFV